jgi:hypothetical protein
MKSKAMSNIVTKESLREVQLETLERVALCLKNSYGPDGSMTAIRKPESEQALGTTAYTKDGHTI